MAIAPSKSPTIAFDLTINGKPLYVKSRNLVLFSLVETISGFMNKAYMRFFDEDYDKLEKYFIDSGDKVEFRFGWDEGDMSNWRRYSMFLYDIVYTRANANGAYIDIWCGDKSMHLDQSTKSESFKDSVASEIVNTIAERYGYKTVIESTFEKFDYIRKNTTELRFIVDDVMGNGVISAGDKRGDYRFFMRNGDELHFHTPDYKQPVHATYNVHTEMRYPIIKFRYRDNSRNVLESGGYNIAVNSYDPVNKVLIEIPVTYDNTPEKILLGKDIPDFEMKGTEGRYIIAPYHRTNDSKRFAKHIWYSEAINSFLSYMQMRTDPLLEPGKLVEILVANPSAGGSKKLNGSGKYLVETVFTSYSNRFGYTSNVYMSRNAFLRFNQEATTGSQPQNAPEGTTSNTPLTGDKPTAISDTKTLKTEMPMD
jgi:hypothetical protein